MQLLTNEGPSVQEGKEGEHPSHLLLKDKFILYSKNEGKGADYAKNIQLREY